METNLTHTSQGGQFIQRYLAIMKAEIEEISAELLDDMMKEIQTRLNNRVRELTAKVAVHMAGHVDILDFGQSVRIEVRLPAMKEIR